MKKSLSKSANKVENNVDDAHISITGSAVPIKDADWASQDEKDRIRAILSAANHWDTISIQQRLDAFKLANIQCPDSISAEEIADYTVRITEGSTTRPPSIIVAWSYYQIHQEMMVFANKFVYNELQQNGTIPMEELEYDNEKVTLLPDVQTFIEDYRANNS